MKIYFNLSRVAFYPLLAISSLAFFFYTSKSDERAFELNLPPVECGGVWRCGIHNVHLLLNSDGQLYYHNGEILYPEAASLPGKFTEAIESARQVHELKLTAIEDLDDFIRQQNRITLLRLAELEEQHKILPFPDSVYKSRKMQAYQAADLQVFVKPLGNAGYGELVKVIDKLRLNQVGNWKLAAITVSEILSLREIRKSQ